MHTRTWTTPRATVLLTPTLKSALPQAVMELNVLLIGQSQFITAVEGRYGCFATQVFTVESAVEILPCIQYEKPEVVLLPFAAQMSQQICQRLRQSNACRNVYCIAVDCLATNLDAIELELQSIQQSAIALEGGADAYLSMHCGDQTPSLIAAEERLLIAYLQVASQQLTRYRELRKTNDFLSTIALADPLTELSNRRALEWELPRQAQKAKMQGIPLSLIILDVDHFKLVNDNHGHLTGDSVLKLLAARLKNHLRGQDVVFRYGGEEFVVVLRKTDLLTANAIAGRLRSAVGEQTFTISRELSLPITISLGVATFRSSDDAKGRSLLHRADQHLLEAKSLGRNQVISDHHEG